MWVLGAMLIFTAHALLLYSYDDEERTNLIHTGSAQALRKLVTSTSFSNRDRIVLPKTHFIFRDIIATKGSLSLPTCPWVY